MADYSLYNKRFIQNTQSHVASAKQLISIVYDLIHHHSVVDVWCGSGSWLSVFKSKYGCSILGIDGDYVDLQDTFLTMGEFFPLNLEKNRFVWYFSR